MTVGVLASSSRIGEITLSGMNVIGPQACHQHTGLQLFLDYIVKGSEEGSNNCMQFNWRVFGVSVVVVNVGFCIFECEDKSLSSMKSEQ